VKVDEQQFLRLAENAGTVLAFDLECGGLTADYSRILTYSGKFNNEKKCHTTTGSEKRILKAAREDFEKADLLLSYNGRMFDVPFMGTRLLELGLPPLPKKHHCDLYLSIKGKLRMSGKSLGAVGSLLELGENKMHVGQRAWRERDIATLVERCESDVLLLEQLYQRVKHLIYTIST
jgi:uncharacterized protein YprB with RNaseH-like and TPR domain